MRAEIKVLEFVLIEKVFNWFKVDKLKVDQIRIDPLNPVIKS